MTTARDVMRSDAAVSRLDSVLAAAQLMANGHVPLVPVCDDGRLIGVLTQEDIIENCVAVGRDARSIFAGELAHDSAVTVAPEATLETALVLMAEHQVRRLPVVDEGRYVGVLAQGDITRSLVP